MLANLSRKFHNSHLRESLNQTQTLNDSYICQLPTLPANDSDSNLTIQFERCDNFLYKTPFRFSIAQEWDLVCSRQWLVFAGYFIFSLSNFLAFIPCGIFSDKFGRRKAILYGTCFNLVGCSLLTISNSMFMFCGSTMFVGFGYVLVEVTSDLYLMEFVGPKFRFVSNFQLIAHGFGILFLSGLSWLIVNWKYFTFVTTVPINVLLLALQIRYIPESLRWLLTVCRYEKAWKCLEAITKVNNVYIAEPGYTMGKLQYKIDEDRKWNLIPSFRSLTKNPRIRLIYISFSVIGFTRSFISFGFITTLTQSEESFHLNICLFGLLFVIEAFIGALTIKFIRRKRAMFISPILSSACFVALAIWFGSTTSEESQEYVWLELTLGAMAYVAHSAGGSVFHFYLTEVFPTNARATMVGSVKTFAQFGQMLSPLVHLLGSYHGRVVVSTIYAVLAIFPAFLSFTLPETKDVYLPDTFSETKRIANNVISRNSEDDERYDNEYQLNPMLI